MRPRDYVLLVLFCLALYLPGIAAIPPVDRDEARFAEASRQMVESGDYVTIRFQDQLRLKKPVGIYWLQAASAALFDPSDRPLIWPYRLPSVLGATLGVLLTAAAGARLFGRLAGLLGAVLLGSSLVLGVEAHQARTDAALLATVVAAQLALAEAYLKRDSATPPGRAGPILFWLATGLGILLKGPIGLMISALTALALWATDRRIGWLRRLRPWPYALIAIAVVLPWGIAIMLATKGAFLAQSVGHDLIGKVAGGQESHGAPPGFYALTFWGSFWPGSILAGLALPWLWPRRREPAVRFCLAWIVPSWLVFELVPTKLPHYTLPLLPAIAVLAAAAALAPWPRPKGRLGRALIVLLVAGWVALSLGLAAALPLLPGVLDHRLDRLALAAACLIAILLLAALVLHRFGRQRRALGAAGIAVLLFYAVLYHRVLPELEPIWLAPRIASAVAAAKRCPTTTVTLAGISEPSFVFLLGADTRFADGAGAADALLDDPCALSVVDRAFEPAFLARLKAAGATAVPVATVDGFNIARGRKVALTLYARKRREPAS